MNITWTKPSGLTIETNDMEATVAYCEKLGWKRGESVPVEPEAPEGSQGDPTADDGMAGAPEPSEGPEAPVDEHPNGDDIHV